jgi:hypothetical protein
MKSLGVCQGPANSGLSALPGTVLRMTDTRRFEARTTSHVWFLRLKMSNPGNSPTTMAST